MPRQQSRILSRLSRPAVFLSSEFVVIVLGVLAAFAVDEWRDAEAERELRSHLLDGLISDLKEDAVDYAEFAADARDRAEAASVLIALANGQDPSLPGLAPHEAFYVVGRSRRLETVDTTFTEMTASGAGRAFADPRLRLRIARYYALAKDRGDVNDAVLPAILRYRAALEALGLSYVDRERLDTGAALGDARVMAIVRELELGARRAEAIAEDIASANEALLSDLKTVRNSRDR